MFAPLINEGGVLLSYAGANATAVHEIVRGAKIEVKVANSDGVKAMSTGRFGLACGDWRV